jgi:hypothetical protein
MKKIMPYVLCGAAGLLFAHKINDYLSALELAAAFVCVFLAGWLMGWDRGWAKANKQ